MLTMMGGGMIERWQQQSVGASGYRTLLTVTAADTAIAPPIARRSAG